MKRIGMKKKIIIGSIFTVLTLMILPLVSAVEYNTAVESMKQQIAEQIKNIDTLFPSVGNAQKIRTSIKDVISEILSKTSTKERMPSLQSIIKSSYTKSGFFGNIIHLIYGFIVLFVLWVANIPYMLIHFHIIIPFWLFILLIWAALIGA
jgi:hypothetical protein